MDVRLPDGTIVKGVPDGMSKADLMAKLEANGYKFEAPSAPTEKVDSKQAFIDTAQSSGVGDNLLAGIGGMMKAPYVGVRQLLGKTEPGEVKEWFDSMAGLGSTKAGFAGQVIGGAALPVAASVAAGPSAASFLPALGMGGVMGFMEPVAEDGSRIKNTIKGAAFNAAIPAAVATGSIVKRAIVDPFRKAGQDQIAGRVLNRFASDPAKAVANASAPVQYVKGSNPTLAESTLDPGLATLQETLRSTDAKVAKNALVNRFQQNSTAQLDALREVAKTPQQLQQAIAQRGANASENYGRAFANGIDADMAEAVRPQIDNLIARLPDEVIGKAKELARIKGQAITSEGSLEGLHYTKLALDDLIDGAAPQSKAALVQLKNDFMSTLDEIAPDYRKAVAEYAKESKPINAMQTGQKLYSKVTRALMEGTEAQTIKPDVFANALRDEVSLVKAATGRSATLRELFPEAEIKQLNAIKKDLQRQVRAQGLAKVNGSPTTQYLIGNDILRQNIGPIGMPKGFAENAFVTNFLARPTSFAYGVPEDAVRGLLAEAVVNPQLAATLMQKAAKPGLVEGLLSNSAYRLGAPAAGYSGGGLLMNVQQE